MKAMLKVTEIFHSIQGESSRAGLPCVFIRLSGCNLRCAWCDTPYAFDEGLPMEIAEVLALVEEYDCPLVEITGGEPLLQREAIPLMERLLSRGYDVLLETGGSLPIGEVPAGVKRVVDVKCPSSGHADANRWENLDLLREGDEIKFVLAGREDYDWAVRQISARRLAGHCPLIFMPVHGVLDPGEMARWVIDDRLPVRVQIQLHKVLWPGEDRGV
jgi:7-carboxy-7-deazaguanine synthase